MTGTNSCTWTDGRENRRGGLTQVPIIPETYQLGQSFFLPTIVTTAPLYTLRYRPTEISLETGSYDNLDPNEIETIPWVRFHKTLTAHPGSSARTVLVVNSASLPKFLDVISYAQGFGVPIA